MTPLDFNSHYPGDIEGKVVAVNSRMYVIGPHLHEGAEKIVYHLGNIKTQTFLHVIKIIRLPRERGRTAVYAKARATLAKQDPANANIVPVTIEIDVPGGGIAEIQPYIDINRGLSNDDMINNIYKDSIFGESVSPAMSLAEKQKKIIKNLKYARSAEQSKDYEQSRSICESTLELNKFDTRAISLLSQVSTDQGDHLSALQHAKVAALLEPNIFSNRYNEVRCTARCSRYQEALLIAEKARYELGGIADFNESIVNLRILVGQPDTALEGLDDCSITPEKKTELKTKIQSQITNQSRAKKYVDKARILTREKKYESALTTLGVAYKIYDNDPLIELNLGAALVRNENYLEAADYICSSIMKLTPPFQALCSANLSLCYYYAGSYDAAASSFALLYSMLCQTDGNLPTAFADYPGELVWADRDHWSEKHLDTMADAIEQTIQKMEQPSNKLEKVRKLSSAYRLASSLQKTALDKPENR